MCRGLVCWAAVVLLGLAPALVRADIQTGLVGYWPLEEGKGTTTADMSGNGHNGTLNNGAAWVSPGFIGNAAVRNDGNPGSRVSVGTWDPGDRLTLAIWARWTGEQNKAPRAGLIGKRNDWSDVGIRWFSEVMTSGEVRMRNFTQTVSSPAGAMTARINEWTHVAIACDGATARIYLNAQQVGSGAFTLGPLKTAAIGLGCKDGGSNTNTETFSGDLDEARFYDRALSVTDVKQLFEWTGLPGKAQGPKPGDGQTDVAQDVVLSWTPGEFAPPTSGHRVYFGESFNDVSNGVGAVAQDANTYTPPQPLALGKTYYWRVDAADTTPDKPFLKGDVWSFTAEPYAYPVKPVTATASSAQPGMGPEKTIDGSGLTGDLHGTEGNTMWLSTGVQPNWIQYQFDKLYKLYDLKVWNSNQVIESYIGFGVRKVTIEYSADGTTWATLDNVPEFTRAPGAAGYAGNITVNMGGVMARFVKLTINNTWSGVSPVASLSEVRFSHVPVQTRAPQPATGATGLSVGTILSWRPGREAAAHKVYFGADPDAVVNGTAAAGAVTGPTFDPGALTYGTTYYWRVDEVNAVTYPGEVWSFTTREFATVDDFESYDDKDNCIYDTWLDGIANGNSGSQVGYLVAPFAEQTIVHGGKQSMPLEYNNVNTPYFSETEQVLSPLQDWTGNGADTLVLYFQGRGPAFFQKAPGDYLMASGGTDIWNTADQFRLAFQRLTGNGAVVARVESLTVTDPWAKAGVMIRESLAAGAKFAAVYATPGNGVRFQARATADAAAISDTAVVTAEQTALKIPVWIKLERVGNVFNGYYSTDGVKWTAMSWNPQTIPMTGTIYIGLAVTSHNAAAVATAEFSNVATTAGVTGSWDSQSIGVAAAPGNTPGQLYVMVQDSSGKSKLVNHPDPLATTLAGWQPWRIPLSEFTAAGVKLTAVKKVVMGVGDRANPKSDGAGLIFVDDIGVGHPASAQ